MEHLFHYLQYSSWIDNFQFSVLFYWDKADLTEFHSYTSHHLKCNLPETGKVTLNVPSGPFFNKASSLWPWLLISEDTIVFLVFEFYIKGQRLLKVSEPDLMGIPVACHKVRCLSMQYTSKLKISLQPLPPTNATIKTHNWAE